MKLFNLLLILVVNVLISSSVMAVADQDADFTNERDRETANIKQRIQILEERLNCIQKGKDFEALKSCNQAADNKLDALDAKIKAQNADQRSVPDKKQSNTKPNHPDNKQQDNKTQKN